MPLFVIACKKKHYRFTRLQLCHLLGDFQAKIQSSMTIFHYINGRMHNLPNFIPIIDIQITQISIITDIQVYLDKPHVQKQ
jgi:hypothetical protein